MTTQEYVLATEPELQAASDRREKGKLREKQVRRKAAVSRACRNLEDVETFMESDAPDRDIKPVLASLKKEHKAQVRALRRRKKKVDN